MRFVRHTDIVAVKTFVLGLMRFRLAIRCPPIRCCCCTSSLVALLMLVFPINKLLHAPGLFFSPTRNQVDNPRDERHLRLGCGAGREEAGGWPGRRSSKTPRSPIR